MYYNVLFYFRFYSSINNCINNNILVKLRTAWSFLLYTVGYRIIFCVFVCNYAPPFIFIHQLTAVRIIQYQKYKHPHRKYYSYFLDNTETKIK